MAKANLSEKVLQGDVRAASRLMRNIDDGRMLVDLLLRETLIDALDHDEELDGWLRQLMMQVGEVHQRLRTLHYKNLGQLLSLHERIEAGPDDASK